MSGPAAANLYSLTVLASSIQGNHENRTSFWAIAPSAQWHPDNNPDHIAVNLDAPAGSSSLSTLVADLLKLDLHVVDVNSVPLAGNLFGFRYMIVLGANHPVEITRVRADLRQVFGPRSSVARLIGAWRAPTG